MTYEKANEMFPVWASAEAVRILDEPPKAEEPPFRHKMTVKQERFIKRYAFAIGFIFALAVYSVLLCCITGTIVKRNTAQEMTAQFEAEMEAYKNAEMGKRIVTGNDSKTAAMREDAKQIAKVLYGVRTNNTADLRTLVWCVLNRVDNKAYPNTIAEVVAQPNQWMGYSDSNPVLDDLFNIAYGELEIWYGGIRPCPPDYVFMNWTPSEITLRDTFEFSSKTHSWRVEA